MYSRQFLKTYAGFGHPQSPFTGIPSEPMERIAIALQFRHDIKIFSADQKDKNLLVNFTNLFLFVITNLH
jgi:hypothetical protein